jgi:hypothetical protein
MQELRDLVERIEPMPKKRGDWDAVVRDARRRRPVLLGSVAGIATAAAALFVLVLFQPWSTDRRTFLERALAAVDDGPVIHAVVRGDWGGTNVNLETGERTPAHGENEIWYDARRQRIRVVSRLGEAVIHDKVYEQDRASREQIALGRDYKAALASGSARTAGEDVIDGQRVTWVVVVSEMLPHAGGPLREWTQQVAVSNETFKPVATRDAVGGKPARGTLQRVLKVEALPAGDVEFGAPSSGIEGPFNGWEEPTTREAVADVLGRAGVWLGEEHAGLPLARVGETFVRQGKQSETALTGPAADDAKACAEASRRRAERPDSGACRRMRQQRHGYSIRGDTVYLHGPVVWGETKRGVWLFYGTLGDDPSTYRKDLVPLESEPFVKVSVTTELPTRVVGGAYFPDEGTLFIGAGDRQGNLRYDRLYVVISAASPELIVSAARALKPMP